MARVLRVPFVLGLAAVSLAGCGVPAADLEAARAKAKAAEEAATAAAAKAAAADQAAATLKAELDAAKAAREELAAAKEDALAKATAARASLDAEIAARKAEKKEKEDRIKELEIHRDELTGWVEHELLPLAEKQDERLVNLKVAAESMAAEVARIRKLEWKWPVMRRLVSRDQVRDWNMRDLKREMDEKEARRIVASSVEMGLMKPGTDLYKMFGQFMEAGVAAFYKPDTDTFYHVAGNDGRGAYPVVFHELVHAIEDQHYKLDVMMKAERDSDRSLAVKGLVEGTASFYSEIYEKANPEDRKAMQQSQRDPALAEKQAQMLQEVPSFFIAMMAMYPYNNGKEFVRAFGGSDTAVTDAVFKDPPVSTEQVLHPAKFKDPANRDYPRKVAKPDLKGILDGAWEELDDDNMGELMTGALLATLKTNNQPQMTLMQLAGLGGGILLKGDVKKAAEGWDGDRYAMWISDNDTKCCIVWTSVWDSEQDAQEFADTYGPLMVRRVTGKMPEKGTAPRATEASTGRVSVLERRGNLVCAVLGAPADKADACLAAGLAVSIEADPRDRNDAAR